MRYYISDLHFSHGNINEKHDKRGFSTTEEMNEYMISQWNKKVQRNHEVVILGDFAMAKGEEVNAILRRLNGKKYLIQGNHDRFLKDPSFDKSLFKWIEPYMELGDNKRKVILSHYPVFCYNGQYRLDDQGNPNSYMLYGHVHNTKDEVLVNQFINTTREQKMLIRGEERNIPCHMINCFCMFSDYTPLTLDEWIALDEERRKKLSE